MKQPMTPRAKGDEILGSIGSTFPSRNDVMNLQIAGVAAAWPLAAVPVARQNKPPGLWRNGGCVALSRLADLRIAPGAFEFGR